MLYSLDPVTIDNVIEKLILYLIKMSFSSWFLPFIGHMGICYTNGVIRDFAGPYFVSEDQMGFGRPTRYWKLSVDKIPFVTNKKETWDRAVKEASEEYKKRMVMVNIIDNLKLNFFQSIICFVTTVILM